MRIAPIGLPSRSSGAPIENPPRVLLACLGRGRAVGRLRLGRPQSRGPMGYALRPLLGTGPVMGCVPDNFAIKAGE